MSNWGTRTSFAGPVYIISLFVGIITMMLPAASVQASLNGNKETFFSPLITSFLGPFVLILFVIALVLFFMRRTVPSVIASLLGAGIDVYFIFTKVASTQQKVIEKGYEIIKARPEYGMYMSGIAVVCIVLWGLMALNDHLNN